MPGELLEIVLELRNLIFSVAPSATEAVRRNGLTYYDRERGGPVSAGICQIGLEPDHVRLAFVHGAFLPDPQRLLQGDVKYKRYVRLDVYKQAPWDDLRDLIAASARFDPYTLSGLDAIHSVK
jgi:hypothetical protein